jgi:hypothetical protein
MAREKQEREEQEIKALQVSKKQPSASTDLPMLGKPQANKSMFDDIDIGEDDAAEVVEEKSQKKSLL